MIRFLSKRLFHAAFTILGVMLLTFLLFRVMAGDIAAAYVGKKAPQRVRADWLENHGYNKPQLLNYHRRLLITDNTDGDNPFSVSDNKPGDASNALALVNAQAKDPGDPPPKQLLGRYVWNLSKETPLASLTEKHPITIAPDKSPTTQPVAAATTEGKTADQAGSITFLLSNGKKLRVRLEPLSTAGDFIKLVNEHPDNKDANNKPLVTAGFTAWSMGSLLDSQFVDHLVKSVTFRARSLKTNERLLDIIIKRAPVSLAFTLPAMAAGFLLSLIISSFVAYFRGTMLDKLTVFLTVLAMCIPFLAFMIAGQWLVFKIAPLRAYGTYYRSNLYVPIFIMVIAGLGASVRFYRTIILDQTNQDYVRTAIAKGASLPSILFKHILKNCMLPILTNLILSLPFLIMGSLLVETYFGIPGLGDLTLTSITSRDEPIMNAVVFLTAVIYTIAVMLTDITYAIFDPRIRLK